MKAIAIEKCRERLRRGATAITGMEAADNGREFAICWESYLVSMKAIGEILRTGSRGHRASEIFLSERWPEVSGDPLLRYLLEARNVEEHGLEPTANFTQSWLALGGPGESIRLDGTFGPGGTMRVTPLNGSTVTITYSPKSAKLLPVEDIKGQTWTVPTEHLGKPVADPSPVSIARAGLTYFTQLVSDAQALA